MIVANDLQADTRVMRMAGDLSQADLAVTVIGISSGGTESTAHDEAGLTVTTLPIDEVLRERAWSAIAEIGRRYVLPRDIELARLVFHNFQRDVGAEIGWLRHDYFRDRARRNREANTRQSDADKRHRVRTQQWAHRAHRPETGKATALIPAILLGVSAAARAAHRLGRIRRRLSRLTGEPIHSWIFRMRESRLTRRLARTYSRYRRREQRLRRRLEAGGGQFSRNWRQLLPELHDYEAAFGPALDSLRPDIIHAHDVHLLGVAARAAARAKVSGRTIRLIYDAHEYVRGLATYPKRTVTGFASLEDEYIGRADRVVTVSQPLAEVLQADHDLVSAPTVVMNTPDPAGSAAEPEVSLRERAKLPTEVPLIVYSGGIDATRGVELLVRSMARLPAAHLALVSRKQTDYLTRLIGVARDGGFEDRIHVLPFVAPGLVPGYLASATIAVHPMISGPLNHEVALPNKLFEYVHARLPIVVSDCRAMAEFVTTYGIGVVFKSGDLASLHQAISLVLADPGSYRDQYDRHDELLREYSWPNQRRLLFGVYSDLLGRHIDPEQPVETGAHLALGDSDSDRSQTDRPRR